MRALFEEGDPYTENLLFSLRHWDLPLQDKVKVLESVIRIIQDTEDLAKEMARTHEVGVAGDGYIRLREKVAQ
jgi:hypothetical protein